MNIERKAIEVLAERGWGKGAYLEPHTGNVCGLGAIAIAVGMNDCDINRGTLFNPPAEFDAHRKHLDDIATEQFPDRIGTGWFGFFGFNDHPDTNIEDVLLVLEKAAVRADEVV